VDLQDRGTRYTIILKANGGERANVAVGEKVEFVGIIEVPPGTGTVVGAEWDFEGAGDYPSKEKFDFSNNSFSRMTVKANYAFSKPGRHCGLPHSGKAISRLALPGFRTSGGYGLSLSSL
jgi:hypothetical protein